MSKLESAFSKALQEKPPEETQDVTRRDGRDTTAVPLNLSAEKAVSKQSGIGELVSSKNQIRQMSDGRRLSDEELAHKRLIHPGMKDTKLLNIYRNLRIKLLAAARGRNFVTLITSVVPRGGSSLVSANVAASFAFDEGKTAMLVEGNVHSPSLGELFDLSDDTQGLMDYLELDDLPVDRVMHETGIPRLRFIPSGRARENSAEYFTSEKMKATIDELVSRYPDRYSIVDAPSIQESADARVLLDLCDQVVLVVPYGACTEQEIKNAAETIGSEKLVGVVLNQF